MTNFYDVLGLSKEAKEAEIKKAYRTLSLKYHPDRNPDEEATRKFQEINEAYETLGDTSKRQQYDMQSSFGNGMQFRHMNSMDEFSDFNEINNLFSTLFGGMQGMQGMHSFNGMPNIRVFHSGGGPGNFHAEFSTSFHSPPPAITKDIEISLEQAYHGCSIPIVIDRWIIMNNNKVMEKENVTVTIPPGMDESDALLLKGRGNIINEDVKGDVRVNIKIINNTIFKRQGLDLILQRKISLKEALCGFKIDIHHINGKVFSLNNSTNPTVIKPGFKKVIPNLGMNKDNTTGNLLLELEIEFPDKLNEEQMVALSEIL
jgi:DnaJ-class molecular chaperone